MGDDKDKEDEKRPRDEQKPQPPPGREIREGYEPPLRS